MFARATPEGPLFSHLLSSRPPRDPRENAAATAASVVFHAGVLTTLVLATLTVSHIVPTVSTDSITVSFPLNPTPAFPRPAAAVPQTVPAPGIALAAPTIVPSTIIPFEYKGPTVGDILRNDPAGIDEANRAAIPGAANTGSADASHPFTVYTVAPELRNGAQVSRALERNYPPLLRDAGIGGEVLLWLLVDETGSVVRADLKQSSGHTAFDDAALKVALTMKFSPALNRDQKVKVWVAVPIRFSAR